MTAVVLHDCSTWSRDDQRPRWPAGCAQTADFAQTVQVIAMDGFAGYKTAADQVMSWIRTALF
jgi:hypothetical protein